LSKVIAPVTPGVHVITVFSDANRDAFLKKEC